jgi:hypothetical protein
VLAHAQKPAREPGARAARTGPGLSPAGGAARLLQLQRAHGNRAMQRALKAALRPPPCDCGGACETCRAKGGGRPLDPATRAEFEGRFGHDFGAVRLHADGRAAASALAHHAAAYTVGTDVVFGPGQYAPATARGRLLLAHELAHVVQQARGTAAGSAGGAAWERDADRAAADAVAGRPATVRRDGLPPPLQKQGLPQQVIPGNTDLSRLAQAYRHDHPDLPASANLVAFEYSVRGGGRQVRVVPNLAGVAHSEEVMDQFVRDAGGQAVTVYRVYSERQPCGPSMHDCEGLLLRRYPKAEVTYGYQYQSPLGRGPQTRAGQAAERIEASQERIRRTGNLEWDFPGRQPPPYSERLGGPVGPAGPRGLAPRLPSAATAAEERRVVASLEAQTARSARFTARVELAASAATAVFQIVGTFALNSVLSKVESARQKAEQIREQAGEAKTWAEEEEGAINLWEVAGVIIQAIERHDRDTLFGVASSLVNLADALSAHRDRFDRLAKAADARARALDELVKTAQAIVQWPSETAQVTAFDLWQALEPLAGSMSAIAADYRGAADTVGRLVESLRGLASKASRQAWQEIGRLLAQDEAQRKRPSAADEGRAREADIDRPTVLADPERRAAQQQDLTERLGRAAQQPKAAEPKKAEPKKPEPVPSRPAGLPSLQPASSQQPLSLLPGAPGEGPVQQAARVVGQFQEWTARLVQRGTALRDRLGGNERPNERDLRAFAQDAENWRTAIKWWMNRFENESREEAKNGLGRLLDENGARLRELRTQLGV